MISYTRLHDGRYGILVDGEMVPLPGQRVEVTRLDGKTKAERVGVVLWVSDRGDRSICTTRPPWAESTPVPGGVSIDKIRLLRQQFRERATRFEPTTPHIGYCKDTM